jgi:class 3 adenylate cyclase
MLSRNYARTLSRVEDLSHRLRNIHTGLMRFLPLEFLTLINKTEINEIKLGDQFQKDITILFADIRNFTSLSESMSAKDNFDFLNSFLKRLGPVVRNNGGFIERYIGDAILAIFPNKCEDGLKAAHEIQLEIHRYNQHRESVQYNPISIGISLHFDNMLLGIIGEEERMQGTIISDGITKLNELDNLTKYFKASILITESFYNSLYLPDHDSFLYLGRIQIPGQKDSIGVFQPFDPMDTPDPKIMEGYKIFEVGLTNFHRKKFTEAIKSFKKALEYIPDHEPSKAYIRQSQKAMDLGVAEIWDGSLLIDF